MAVPHSPCQKHFSAFPSSWFSSLNPEVEVRPEIMGDGSAPRLACRHTQIIIVLLLVTSKIRAQTSLPDPSIRAKGTRDGIYPFVQIFEKFPMDRYFSFSFSFSLSPPLCMLSIRKGSLRPIGLNIITQLEPVGARSLAQIALKVSKKSCACYLV
jgi:hypothetical protein